MIWNAFLLALRAIRRNILRSFLTVLGIVIGVAAVITLVTVGNGATAKITEDISKLGTNILMVTPGQFRGPGGSRSQAKSFEAADVKAVRNEIDHLRAVAPTSTKSMTAVYINKNWSTTVVGADNDYFKAGEWSIENGSQFTDSELRSGRAVCLVGATVRKELFGEQDPVGQKIRLNKITFSVIGLLASKGQSSMGTDQDDRVIIPLRTFQRRVAGNQDVNMIMVSVADGYSTTDINDKLTLLFRERRKIAAGQTDDFQVRDLKEMADTLTGVTKLLTTLLGAVAAVSLVVGGIGIMNIMLVSVTERTREIGTRLAIGALERDVLLQFLVEAVVLSSFGGLFGILVALVGSSLLVKVLQIPLVMNAGIIFLAFLFSGAVGVIFGFFPARKAASLDPIEALRYE